jgi:hypothetical protein
MRRGAWDSHTATSSAFFSAAQNENIFLFFLFLFLPSFLSLFDILRHSERELSLAGLLNFTKYTY